MILLHIFLYILYAAIALVVAVFIRYHVIRWMGRFIIVRFFWRQSAGLHWIYRWEYLIIFVWHVSTCSRERFIEIIEKTINVSDRNKQAEIDKKYNP